jgi:hypothetical protein
MPQSVMAWFTNVLNICWNFNRVDVDPGLFAIQTTASCSRGSPHQSVPYAPGHEKSPAQQLANNGLVIYVE